MRPTLPVWTAELSVGNALVDLQHQKLITLCNKASACLDDGSPESTRKFHSLLNDLATLATEHFRTEEVLLEQNKYP
jgi:hemerythrin-like metal-binding protein